MPSDWRSTGLPSADARDDFTRARRRAAWAKAIARLSGRPGDVDVLLPYDEVIAALGPREIVPRGLQTVSLDSIVGSTDRVGSTDDVGSADGLAEGLGSRLGSADDDTRAFLTAAGWEPDGAHRTLDLTGDGSVTVKQIRLHTDLG